MTDNSNTFQPKADDDGLVRAGGLPLFRIDEQGHLRWADRYTRRCQARGTPDVPVDPVDLFLEIRAFLSRRLGEF